ncbi:MAG: dienelactone hydrolase family protein [Woeseiaceae bacterium]|nr:dienelactone hydrolase family protein [Woeseiaceae bacterium]
MAVRERVVAVQVGDTACEGLLTCGDGSDAPKPGILVCHTIRGRTDFEDDRARALAGMGYAALTADLYGLDSRGSDIDTLRDLMNDLRGDRRELQQRLLTWFDCLRGIPEIDAARTAAIGFCFGGLCVLDLARSGAEVAGVVSFHGIFEPPPFAGDRPINAKVLALHGWDDPLATPEQAVALARELTAAGADWQIHAYGNTLHAFTNPAANDPEAGTVYNANADRRSWTAMQNFFAELFGE